MTDLDLDAIREWWDDGQPHGGQRRSAGCPACAIFALCDEIESLRHTIGRNQVALRLRTIEVERLLVTTDRPTMTTYRRADGELIGGEYAFVTELEWFETDDDLTELVEERWECVASRTVWAGWAWCAQCSERLDVPDDYTGGDLRCDECRTGERPTEEEGLR